MNSVVDLRVNEATAAAIAAHLRRCDDDFMPRLSERVEIDEYSRKIVGRAMRVEAWAGDVLVGLVAAYVDPNTQVAYITTVSVDPAHRKQGLASRLIGECLAHAQDQGCVRVLLEVDSNNAPAIALYQALGFSLDGVTNRTNTMRRELQPSGGQG